MFNSLISPRFAINMLQKKFEKTLNIKLHDYQLYFDSMNESFQLIVDQKHYKYDSPEISNMIIASAKKQLKDTQKLDALLIDIDPKNIYVKIFITDNNEKKYITQKL